MRTFERLDDVVRWLLVILLGLLPFFFIPVQWADTVQSKVVLAASILLVAAVPWIVARFLEGSTRVPWTFTMGAAVLVPLVYAVSTALAGFTSVSLVGAGVESDTLALVCVGFAALALSASVFSMHPRRINQAIRALLLGSLVLLLLQVVHFLAPSLLLGGVFAGQTGNAFAGWHELAMMAGLVAFLSLSLLGTPAAAGSWKYCFFATGVMSILLLVIANYSDVWMLLLAASLLLVVIRGYRTKALAEAAFWRKEGLLLGGVVISLFFFVFGSFIVNVLPERIRIAQNEARPSWQGTLAIGQQSLSKPAALLFGAGPNTFTREWGLYKSVDVNQTPFWNTDFTVGVASIPTSLVTVGLLGLLGWITFILALLWMSLRFWMSPTDAPAAVLALPVSVGVLYLVALQVLSIPGEILSLLTYLLAGFLVALLVPSFVPARTVALGRGDSMSWLPLIGATLAALVLVISAGASVRVVFAEMLINKAIVTYNTTQDPDKASVYIRKALRVYPGDDRAHRSAVELGLLSLQKLIASSDTSEAAKAKLQATLKDTIQNGLDAVSLNGASYQNWLALASLYAQLAGSKIPGADENARAAFQKALDENPTSPVPYLNVAQLELLQDNPQAALQNLARAVQLKPDFAAAYYIASQIYASQKDYQNALQAAANAAKYASGDSQAWYNLGIIAYSAKNYQDAAGALQQALVIQPQFANALYVLGLSYYQLKDTKDAITVFEALDKLDPGQEAVTEIISTLKAGKPLPQADSDQGTQPAATSRAQQTR